MASTLVRRGYGLADLEAAASRPARRPTTGWRRSPSSSPPPRSCCWRRTDACGSTTACASGCRRCRQPPIAITLRHLLTHTLGPDRLRRRDARCHDGEQLRDADVLRLLEAQERTYFEPGTGYRYSNSGYALLALVVERASGQRSRTSCASASSSRWACTTRWPTCRAARRSPTAPTATASPDGGWTRTDQSPTSAVLGDGGIYSSIDDLAKWDAALYDDRLLSDESRRARVHAGHADRRSRCRIRLRLAHHRRQPVAFRRNHRFPQRDRALPGAAADRGPAQQPQRSRALPDRPGDRAAASRTGR